MTQGMLPSPGTPDWQFLARGQQDGESISRCPGGHIHLDYGSLTLRFDPDEFLALAEMVAGAAARIYGGTPPMRNALDYNPSATFSLN